MQTPQRRTMLTRHRRFPMQIVRIYTDDINLAQLVIPSIYVICAGTIFQGIGNAYFEAVSGTGNTTAALYLEAVILVIYIAFIWAMTHLTTHVHWVWTAEILYGALLGIFCYIYMKFAKWDKKHIWLNWKLKIENWKLIINVETWHITPLRINTM